LSGASWRRHRREGSYATEHEKKADRYENKINSMPGSEPDRKSIGLSIRALGRGHRHHLAHSDPRLGTLWVPCDAENADRTGHEAQKGRTQAE
jgi:hypothetical protein